METYSSELWSVPKVAQHLDISHKRVYNMIRAGELESLRLSQRGIRVLRKSVDRFVQMQMREEKLRRR